MAAVLDTEQLRQIAEVFAREQYSSTLRDVPYAVKRFIDLVEPPGAYFCAVPSTGLLIGDAGFFVSALDGRVIRLGTGEFPEGLGVGSRKGKAAAAVALARIVRGRLGP